MKLTKSEKARLLEKYQSFIRGNVSDYYKSIRLPFSGCWDDLAQEAGIAFYKNLDKIEEEKDVFSAYIHMFHAMNRYKESQHVITIAHGKYKEISKKFSRVPLIELDGAVWTDDLDTEVDYSRFFDRLPEQDQRLLTMKEAGYKNREIAGDLQMSEAWVSKRAKKLRKLLAEHLRCDDD